MALKGMVLNGMALKVALKGPLKGYRMPSVAKSLLGLFFGYKFF
jgi:hypothetical protein